VRDNHIARASAAVEGTLRSKALDSGGVNAGGGEGVAHAAPASNTDAVHCELGGEALLGAIGPGAPPHSLRAPKAGSRPRRTALRLIHCDRCGVRPHVVEKGQRRPVRINRRGVLTNW